MEQLLNLSLQTSSKKKLSVDLGFNRVTEMMVQTDINCKKHALGNKRKNASRGGNEKLYNCNSAKIRELCDNLTNANARLLFP